MELVLLLALGATATVAATVVHRTRSSRLSRLLMAAAHELALDAPRAVGVLRPSVSGRLGELRITMSDHGKLRGRTRFSIRVDAPSLATSKLELRRERPRNSLRGDLETGDADFDRAILVRGTPVFTTAVLDQVTRTAIVEHARRGGVVAHGALTIEVTVDPPSADAVAEKARHAVDLVRRLSTAGDLAGRLARNASEDPVAGVRLANLQLLAAHFPNRPTTRQALHSALEDPAPELRLAAARRLGPAGQKVLEALCGELCAADHLTVQALRALDGAPAAAHAAYVLSGTGSRIQHDLAIAAVEALGRSGGERAVELLRAILASSDETVVAAAVRSLVACNAPGLEGLLVELLGHRSRVVQHAAVGALALCGSIAAVQPLRGLTAWHVTDQGMRRAAAAAIAAIQKRSSGAEPGRLALVADDAGHLSLADGNPSGRLTLSASNGASDSAEKRPAQRSDTHRSS